MAWDERALIDWEGGILAAVHDWVGSVHPGLQGKELHALVFRADASARASKPACFLELMRRFYLSLAQDLAFAPRQLDLLNLETRLQRFYPRPGVASRVAALRKAGVRSIWIQESGSSIANVWRAQLGVGFDEILEIGPVHRCLGETTARAIGRQSSERAKDIVLVRGPGRSPCEDPFSQAISDSIAGELFWPETQKCTRIPLKLDEHWSKRVLELLQ